MTKMRLDYEEEDIYVLDAMLEQLESNNTIDPISVVETGILTRTDDVNYSLFRFEYYSEILKNHCADEFRDFKGLPKLKRNGKTKFFRENGGFEDYYHQCKQFDAERKKTDQPRYKTPYQEIKKNKIDQKKSHYDWSNFISRMCCRFTVLYTNIKKKLNMKTKESKIGFILILSAFIITTTFYLCAFLNYNKFNGLEKNIKAVYYSPSRK